MTPDQAPERLFAVIDGGGVVNCHHSHSKAAYNAKVLAEAIPALGVIGVTEYIRADLHAAVVAERDEAKSERAAAIRATLAVAKERNEAVRLMREYLEARDGVAAANGLKDYSNAWVVLNKTDDACRAFLAQHGHADAQESAGD